MVRFCAAALALLASALAASSHLAPGTGSRCDLESEALRCPGEGQVCDMIRNACVAACSGADCCADVSCPSGSACAPDGRCGIAAGAGCYDMGSSWWTGRDVPPTSSSSAAEGAPSTFDIRNDGGSVLYFESTPLQTVRFDVHDRPRDKRLALPENQYCPCRCPAEGPPTCRDCGPPIPMVRRLEPGGRQRLTWSGTEEVGNWRICGRGPAQFCSVPRRSVTGTYSLEVCAYAAVSGGEPDAQDPDRLVRAVPSGTRECRRVQFVHPATSPVVVRFGT